MNVRKVLESSMGSKFGYNLANHHWVNAVAVATRRSQSGTWLRRSPRMYKFRTMIDRNVDSVMMIMLRQKYAPVHNMTRTTNLLGLLSV